MHLFGVSGLLGACMHAYCHGMRIRLRDGAIEEATAVDQVSRSELARRIGVDKTTAFRVERGDVDPSPKFIAGLMDATGEPFEALFEIVKEAAVA